MSSSETDSKQDLDAQQQMEMAWMLRKSWMPTSDQSSAIHKQAEPLKYKTGIVIFVLIAVVLIVLFGLLKSSDNQKVSTANSINYVSLSTLFFGFDNDSNNTITIDGVSRLATTDEKLACQTKVETEILDNRTRLLFYHPIIGQNQESGDSPVCSGSIVVLENQADSDSCRVNLTITDAKNRDIWYINTDQVPEGEQKEIYSTIDNRSFFCQAFISQSLLRAWGM